MIQPGELWREPGGIPLDQLREEDGSLNAEQTTTTIRTLLADNPHWRNRPGPSDGGARETGPVQRRQPGLSDLMKG